jgi:hypothetical protein
LFLSLPVSTSRLQQDIALIFPNLTTDITVLFPFHIPIYIPRPVSNAVLDALSALRIISPRREPSHPAQNDPSFDDEEDDDLVRNSEPKHFVRLRFHMNFITAPLIADLFLLAILAIGRQEVHDGESP